MRLFPDVSEMFGVMKTLARYRYFMGALLVSAVAFIFCRFGVLESFDTTLRDRLYQTNRGVDNTIRIISIDDRTLNELGPLNTWSRDIYTTTLENLGSEPSVIAFDIMFFGETDKAADDALAAACERHGSVITASQIKFETGNRVDFDDSGAAYINNMKINSVDYPYDALRGVTRTGYANTPSEADGVVRKAIASVDYDGGELTSLASEIYSVYCANKGVPENEKLTDEFGRTNISYSAKPGQYEAVSLCDVYYGRIDPRVFKDCIVLVGAYANGLQDNFKVSNSISSQMYGVEIHANIVQAYMDNVFPQQVDLTLICAVTALLTFLLFILFRQMKMLAALSAAAAALVLYIIAAEVAYHNGIIIPVIYAPMFIAIGCLINIVRGYLAEQTEKKKIAAAFKKYVAPQVFDEISKKGGYTLKLGGENRHIAVLFVDIRGFTPMSESLEPEQVVDILNSYLNLTTHAIFNNGGTLDKFIGDATMAIFNAPFDLDDYVFRAVCTAMDIVAGGSELEEKFMKLYGKSVGFGVGVNCGNAVVGNIGCDFRMDYTAIGDTVNTAARLESNAKRGQVLISEEVYSRVKDRVEVTDIGEIPLKGKSKGVYVYAVTECRRTGAAVPDGQQPIPEEAVPQT